MTEKQNKLNIPDKYVTLKQAAEISGYSADYIGQLIRQGKLAGKQVYFNTAWVTTAEEISRYLEMKNQGKSPRAWRGHYLRYKYLLSDRLFSFSPWLWFKSFIYALLIFAVITFSLMTLTSSKKANQATAINEGNITPIVVQKNKDYQTAIPVLP